LNLNAAVKEVRSLVQDIRPVLQNTARLTSQLTNGPGALGEWLLPVTLIQGLQRHWLLRSAFKEESRTNAQRRVISPFRSALKR